LIDRNSGGSVTVSEQVKGISGSLAPGKDVTIPDSNRPDVLETKRDPPSWQAIWVGCWYSVSLESN
jgi:hypothetical protein